METTRETELFLISLAEGVCYITPKNILETMFVEYWMPEEMVCLGYAQRLEWHLGKDNLMYERFELSSKGKFYHDFMNIEERAKRAIIALEEINKKTTSQELKKEKMQVNGFMKNSKIWSITPYKGKELTNKPEKNSTLKM